METVISNDDRVAIAEVDYIIHHMNERYLNKIPQKIQDYITILKKRNIKIYVDPHVPLESQGLKEFTLYFLMILNLKYWCDDQRRKDILLMLENNQKKYDEKINNIFDNANSVQGDDKKSSSDRPLNRPRQIIVTGTPTFPNQNEEKTDIIEENKPNEIKSEQKSPLDDMAKQANELTTSLKEENFFTKFINKIKSYFIKK